jgi:hypothetical protein
MTGIIIGTISVVMGCDVVGTYYLVIYILFLPPYEGSIYTLEVIILLLSPSINDVLDLSKVGCL